MTPPAPARVRPASAGTSPAGAERAGGAPQLRPNPDGRIPILEYHLIADSDSRWGRSWRHFRQDLELLYARGYRPITVSQLIDRKFDIPPGTSPVVFTFDDASPGQFRYVERNGRLEIDSTSAVGIWLAFHAEHPDWGNRATFCMLPAAAAGHAFFGERGIQGQQSAWRFRKVKFLADQGFELCDHTLWHANLKKYGDEVVQEQIARGALAIDSAVPGYRVRTFALPLGIWPRNRALAQRGAWKDPKTGKVYRYDFDAILEVSGGPNRSPNDSRFNPLALERIQMYDGELERVLDQLDRSRDRYVAGTPASAAVAAPRR
ncbi:MAG: polysaccharide deacetylase family protein [Gemmatimonadota bacterium]|nr:polysaccharide deacetylase family protein [Gemmatimonadota bacterium]